eukprot:1137139-Pelagomonas_calceolata.AAC.9
MWLHSMLTGYMHKLVARGLQQVIKPCYKGVLWLRLQDIQANNRSCMHLSAGLYSPAATPPVLLS